MATRIRHDVEGAEGQLKRLALLILLLHALGVVAAIATDVMLHGDGSWFVYAISVGDAWNLKWKFLTTRISVYVLTVLPTVWLAELIQLSPVQIARLNAFVFYALPMAQFAGSIALVWNRRPALLFYPLATYILGFALGFGFPSEILIAPGFLWIALFSLDRWSSLHPLFLFSFVAMLASHEATTPTAVAVALAAYSRAAREPDRSRLRKVGLALVLIVPFVFLVTAKFSGGGAGANANTIYVLDPRRVLNSPSLWTLCLGLGCAAVSQKASTKRPTWASAWLYCLVAFVLTLAMHRAFPSISFERGRYDSSRTIIAGTMFVFSLLYIADTSRSSTMEIATAGRERVSADNSVRPFIFAILIGVGVVTGCSVNFLDTWMISERALKRAVISQSSSAEVGQTRFVDFESLVASLHRDERLAMIQIGYIWALPYRCVVLADGEIPAQIVYSPGSMREQYCGLLTRFDPRKLRIPIATVLDMDAFACRESMPVPVDTISRRFMRVLSSLF